MKSTRRAILRGAVPLLVAPVVATRTAAPAPSPTPTARPVPSPTPTPSPAAAALARAARERYGRFLTEEESKMLDERVIAIERRGARLRAFSLKNSEEPATEFRAQR